MLTKSLRLYLSLLAALSLTPLLSTAQDAQSATTFARIFGKSGATFIGRSIRPTSDGGYILAGVETTSTNSILIMKLDGLGRVTWQNTYTVTGRLSDGYQIQQTPSGYIMVAVLGPPNGPSVLLVLSLDSSGAPLWQKTYPTGGSIGALPSTIEPISDGRYLLGAVNYDDRSFPIPPLWALKLDSGGNIVWQREFGLNAGSIHKTADGGYIVAGTSVCSPDCIPWVVKLDSAGNSVWDKLYAIGSGKTFAASARQAPDGGYVVAGNYIIGTTSAALLMKLGPGGDVRWQKGYSSSSCASGAYDAQLVMATVIY